MYVLLIFKKVIFILNKPEITPINFISSLAILTTRPRKETLRHGMIKKVLKEQILYI
jgi:hypothetical protein